MSQPYRGEPILVEIGREGWDDMLDRSERWFGNVLTTQASFRYLVEHVVEKVEEPHLSAYLRAMHERARGHEQVAEELYRSIGREPKRFRATVGRMTSRFREGLADVVGLAGGAASPWRDIHQLQLSNYNSMGTFAVAEQLGFSLGLPNTARMAFDVVAEKSTDDLLLKEFMLELAPASILYGEGGWLRAGEDEEKA